MSNLLTLAKAIEQGRLEDFAAQAEAAGIGPIDRTEFERGLGRLTAPQQVGQTSRSPGRGGSPGK